MRSLEELMELEDTLSATLEEIMVLDALALDMLREDLLHGMTWTQKLLDASFNPCALLDAGLSCHARAMGALSRLRYWTVTNGYATGLQARQILQSYTLGSALLLELIDSLSDGFDKWGEVAEQIQELEAKEPLFGSK